MDILLSTALIIFLLPALLAIAVAIRISSPGPVLFRQERYGRNREAFWLLKFRTMTVAESSGTFRQVQRNDARVTTVGWFLRGSSLDELPQLFNVLMGDMSLVGPRPHAIAMDDAYARLLPGYSDRHFVRPGMTGLAQVCGYRGPTDCEGQIESRMSCDRKYIAEWSLLSDLHILARTPVALLSPTAF